MLSLLWAGSPAPICGPAAISCPGCASESRLPVPKGGRPEGGVGTWLGDPGAIGGDLGVIPSHSLSFAFSCFLSGSDGNPSSTPPFSTGLGGPPQPLRSTISRADLQVRVTWLFANLPRGEPLAGTFRCRNVQSQQEQGYSQAFLPPRLPTTRLGPLASRREFRPSSLQPLIRYRCKCFPARTYSHCALGDYLESLLSFICVWSVPSLCCCFESAHQLGACVNIGFYALNFCRKLRQQG